MWAFMIQANADQVPRRIYGWVGQDKLKPGRLKYNEQL